MTTLRARLRRLGTLFTSRPRGSPAALREWSRLTDVVRFAALFSLLILLPVMLLALLALRSIQGEEVILDRGLQVRADAIADQVQDSLRGRLGEFELDARARLEAGETAVAGVQGAGLLGVYRLTADGDLVSPFVWPGEDDQWTEPPAIYEQTVRNAGELDRAGLVLDAVRAWTRAAGLATTEAQAAEARLGAARLYAEAGDGRALVLVASDHPTVRDRRGVRIADTATLLRAALADREGRRDEATRLYRGIVDRNLAEPWVIDHPAEAFTAEKALDALKDRMDEAARQVALDQVHARAGALYRTSRLQDELRLVATRSGRDGAFVYTPENHALWATVAWEDEVWAFPFDHTALRDTLQTGVVDVANRIDGDLVASLVPAGSAVDDPILRRNLAPDLPTLDVIVRHADPDSLAAQRQRTGLQRRLVIALAVLAASLGIFAAVRTVGREVEAARAKADFAANVSHELRSPITQIRLKGEALQLDLVFDDDDRKEHYDAIVRESERLSRLVDNVLDFSAIERGVKRYTLRAEDLGSIVTRAVDATRSAAEAAGLKLDVHLPDKLPTVWVDREAIGQVMTNLLSNAIKYGSDGKSIEVHARIVLDGVEVSVTDHGIGIAPIDQAKVFEHFYRVQSSEVRRRRGTGIGLTIVRYIVEAHGGTISLQSTLGEGSTFTVSLPVRPPKGHSA